MTCTHRAALKRCHELLQEAQAYVPENEAWHDQVTEILLPCDEAMECPTVPSAPAPQPWTEGELARAITDEKAIAIARQHPETLPSLFAWRTDDVEDLSKHHFTAQDLAADLLAARAEIARLQTQLMTCNLAADGSSETDDDPAVQVAKRVGDLIVERDSLRAKLDKEPK